MYIGIVKMKKMSINDETIILLYYFFLLKRFFKSNVENKIVKDLKTVT